MKAGGGKQKGASFERLVCKHLSLWITEGAKQDVFWRSAMSGGRSTVLNRKGVAAADQSGDISAVAPEGHALISKFFVECKFYRDLSLLSFVFGHARGKLHEFWRVAQQEAAKHKKMPMLVAKQNLERPIVLLPELVDWSPAQRGTADPIAYIVTEGAYVYWFEDLFPVPPPKPVRLPNARAVRK